MTAPESRLRRQLEAARDALDDIVFFATDPQMTQWAVTCAARVRDSITEVLR